MKIFKMMMVFWLFSESLYAMLSRSGLRPRMAYTVQLLARRCSSQSTRLEEQPIVKSALKADFTSAGMDSRGFSLDWEKIKQARDTAMQAGNYGLDTGFTLKIKKEEPR